MVRVFLALVVGMLLGSLGLAMAQAPQQAPPMPCEQQLTQLQKATLQLRKDKAEGDYRGAALEEMVVKLQEEAKAAKDALAKAQPAPEKK